MSAKRWREIEPTNHLLSAIDMRANAEPDKTHFVLPKNRHRQEDIYATKTSRGWIFQLSGRSVG